MTVLHPFLVHFPIAVLLLAVLVGFRARRSEQAVEASWWLWVVGAWSALLATITGLMDHEAYESTPAHEVIEGHEQFGMTATLLSLLLLYWRWRGRRAGSDPVPGSLLFMGLTVIIVAGILAAGYTGGSLVYEHGVRVKQISWPLD